LEIFVIIEILPRSWKGFGEIWDSVSEIVGGKPTIQGEENLLRRSGIGAQFTAWRRLFGNARMQQEKGLRVADGFLGEVFPSGE
jgi:hypothetical protein